MADENPPPFWENPDAVGQPVDLLAFVSKFVRRWPFIGLMGFGCGVFAYVIALSLTPQFSSKAVFLPPLQQVSSTDNPFAALLKTPSTAIYSGLLMSDSVLGNVVERCGLQRVLKATDLQDARVKLARIATVTTSTSGYVTIEVKHKDPEMAKAIASGFLVALAELNDRMTIDSVSHQRRIFQTELQREKEALENAEIKLEKAQESSGVILPQNQTQSALFTIDTVRGQIRTLQVRLSALMQSQTEQAPDVVVVRSQIQALESQLHRLESGTSGAAGQPLTTSKAPAVNLEFAQLGREVKYHQVLFDVMAKQFENAKLEESSAAPGVQVVDYPEVPLRKSWPSRTLFSLVGGVLGVLLALAIIFIKDRLSFLKGDPEKARAMRGVREAFFQPVLKP